VVREQWQALQLDRASRDAFAALAQLDWSAPVSELHWWIADWLADAIKCMQFADAAAAFDQLH